MIRAVIPLYLMLILLCSCSGPSGDLDEAGLKGKVKSITEHQYDARHEAGSWVPGDPSFYGHRIIHYDKDGVYTKSIALSAFNDTTGYTTCRREGGELVEEKYVSTVEDRTTRSLMERVSDEQVNFEVWEGDRLYYEGANYFDARGRISRQIRVVNDLEVTNHYVYEKDLLVENYQLDHTGQRTLTQLYEYVEFDGKGNWTRKLVYVGTEKIVPDLVVTREIEYYR
ncbi:MAG TPA: hypothetical protein ENO20_05455 [Bacteroides sp.]|nr:hypothetical protein [Bacteroides sp.]